MNPIPFRSDVIRMGSVIPKPSPPSMPPPPPPISQSYPSSLYAHKEILSSISMEIKHNDNKNFDRTDNAISNIECAETEFIPAQFCGMEIISHDATSSSSPAMAPYMNIENYSKSSSILSIQSSFETTQFGKESNDTSTSDPVYMNINSGQKHMQNIATSIQYHRRPPPPPPSTPILQISDEEEGSYVNLKTNEIESLRRKFPSTSVTSEISLLDSFTSTGCPIRRVNYAILDLDKKDVSGTSDNTTTNSTLSPSESLNKPRKGYVTIDFKKTDALEIISQ